MLVFLSSLVHNSTKLLRSLNLHTSTKEARVKKVASLAAAALVCGLGSVASAAELYNETFSTDGPVSSYVGTGKIFASEVGTAAMPGASGGKLTLGYKSNEGANNAGCVVTSLGQADVCVSLASVRFELTPKSYAAGSFRWVATSADDLTWVQWNFVTRAWANFYIDSGGISIQNGAATAFTMNQTHTISVFMNDVGTSQSYVGPDGITSYTLADKSWSLFDGTTPLAENVARTSGTELGKNVISRVGFLTARNWDGAQTLSEIDNLVVRDDLSMPVPEPASLGLLAVSGMLFLRRRSA
jgi:hypothetical protein